MIGNGSRLSNDRAGPEISHKSPNLCLFHGGKAWRMPGPKEGHDQHGLLHFVDGSDPWSL
jgi:hypothetical protein